MSDDSLEPSDFRARMEGAFGAEPGHADLDSDLRCGRRRLRRHRAGTSLALLSTVAVLAAGASQLPTSGPQTQREPGPAAGGDLTSDEAIVATCMRKENVTHWSDGRPVSESAALRLLGGTPRLMTAASSSSRVQATLLSEDGAFWGSCQFRTAPDDGVKNAMSVYSTGIGFPRTGVEAYEPPRPGDPDLVPQVEPATPQLETPCAVGAGSTSEAASLDAACDRFTVHWGDRRPAEVAAVRVTTPDGVSSWADVRRGYLSFAYAGEMTPELAARLARGERPGAQRVVFYDRDGAVLVDDRDPGRPAEEGEPDLGDYPSLAWWTG